MADITQMYQVIHELAHGFAEFVKGAVDASKNEADFERKMNGEVGWLAEKLGTQLLFREQYVLATGRADAVYNRFVIEYEPPHSLRENLLHKHTDHAVQQVKDYIEGLAKEERHQRDRLLGVATDGNIFIFVRYHEGHWIVEPPQTVDTSSCEFFLRSLFSLSSGRALIPENLVEDFGNQNDLSRKVTNALYHALEGHSDDLAARLFEQWKLFFGETAGDEAAAGELQHKKELRSFIRGMGLKPDKINMPRFFFALQTYFSFIVENIARLVLQAYAGENKSVQSLDLVANMQGDDLRRELQGWEQGEIYRAMGLRNLLEGDFFAWYLDAWDHEIEAALRLVLKRLADYNPVTIQDDPHSARDLLKKLYHYLLPREIRHDLGEFYTPDWLADRLLNQLNEPLFQLPKPSRKVAISNKRLLDPACGSGTFLVLAARALKANCREAGLSEADTLNVILGSLAGIDLNPLAVMSARVNFLLAIADLLPFRKDEIEIPIYLADSILAPAQGDLLAFNRRILVTAVGPLSIPMAIDTRVEMERLTGLLEEYVPSTFDTKEFLNQCHKVMPDLTTDSSNDFILRDLFDTLRSLHQRGLNGIWARVLKNAFMPLFLEPFDYVVGNPPWINWESLPQAYRERSIPLWQDYGLFVHSGMDTILGKGKKDLSTLMTYSVVERFLKPGGKLGFVITQSVWKTSGAGQGFRRFRIGSEGDYLRVLHVDDLSRLQVFEGASTRTSVFVIQKGLKTKYPVPYTYWQKIVRGKGLDYDSTLPEVMKITRRLRFSAVPVSATDPTSTWITARLPALLAIRKILGQSEYRAHAGVTTWANGIYWFEKVAVLNDGLWSVRNLAEGGKREVDSMTTVLESDLLFPLVRANSVRRWEIKSSGYLLMTQDVELRRGMDEKILRTKYPKVWRYLKLFEIPLRSRSGFKRYFTRKQGKEIIETGPFYSVFNVGDYTFGRYKVVWGRIGNRIDAAVVENSIPQETLSFISTNNKKEAYYMSAVINSLPFQFAVFSYSQLGGKSFGTPQIIQNIVIPNFEPMNSLHDQLQLLSEQAHVAASLAYADDSKAHGKLNTIEDHINQLAAQLWKLKPSELNEIQSSLIELKGQDIGLEQKLAEGEE